MTVGFTYNVSVLNNKQNNNWNRNNYKSVLNNRCLYLPAGCSK